MIGRRIGTVALSLLALALSHATAHGALSASATITPQQLRPNSYKYSLTLNDTGTTPIGTFWFGWFPSYDLLNPAPTAFTAPAGWTGINAPDTFGVASAQFTTTTSALQPGHSLSGFSFTTSETPASIAGTSDFFGEPVGLSYVYIGAPETDPGYALTPTTVVPEPNSLMTMLLGVPAVLLMKRRGRRLV